MPARCSVRSATTVPASWTGRHADGIYGLVRAYSAALGFQIGAHALRATAATNALDHQADIAKVQEWLGHANIRRRGSTITAVPGLRTARRLR